MIYSFFALQALSSVHRGRVTNKSFLTGKRRQCVLGKAPDTSLYREQKGYTHFKTFALIIQVHRAKNLI